MEKILNFTDEGKVLCFTGHRPNKLGGFSGERARRIQNELFARLVSIVARAASHGFSVFVTGGALGVDQIAAKAVLHVRDNPNYKHIRLVVAKPFPSQSSTWPEHAQLEFDKLCVLADQVVEISEDPYTREKMQIRNEWMVDNSAACCAVWNGGNGGTGNCVRYARSVFRAILIVNPYTLVEKWELPGAVRW